MRILVKARRKCVEWGRWRAGSGRLGMKGLNRDGCMERVGGFMYGGVMWDGAAAVVVVMNEWVSMCVDE